MIYTLPLVTRTKNAAGMAANECGWHFSEQTSKKKRLNFNQSLTNFQVNLPYTGRGVDFVSVDGSVLGFHPELTDENGVSRIQAIHWPTFCGDDWDSLIDQIPNYYDSEQYTSNHSHGTVSTAAGKTDGFAKNANIYMLALGGLKQKGTQDGLGWSQVMQLLRAFHLNKPIKRPTVATFGTIPVNTANYPSTAYVRTRNGVQARTLGATVDQLRQASGMMLPEVSGTTYSLMDNLDIKAAMQAATDAGVHICFPAGNTGHYIAKGVQSPRWHTMLYTSGSAFSPSRHIMSDDAICVSSLRAETDGYDGLEVNDFTSRGDRVDLWVAGSVIPAAFTRWQGAPANLGTISDFKVYPFDGSGQYWRGTFSGTSVSTPIAAGIVCCYAEKYPLASAATLKAIIKADAARGRMKIYPDMDSMTPPENAMHPDPLVMYYGLRD